MSGVLRLGPSEARCDPLSRVGNEAVSNRVSRPCHVREVVEEMEVLVGGKEGGFEFEHQLAGVGFEA
jgi:hypothetical protein